MSDTLSTIAAIVAAGAWTPWAAKSISKLFRKGQIDFYERLPAQLGYTPWGIGILLEGTLRTISADMFITKATLSLTRHKDGSSHDFECWHLQPALLPGGGMTKQGWRSFYPLMVRVSEPQHYAMAFTDRQTYGEMRAITDELLKQWVTERSRIFEERLYADPKYAKTLSDVVRRLFEQFKTSKVYLDSSREIDRLCYWEASSYSLKMTLHARRPDVTSHKKWELRVTKEETKVFRLNVLGILEEICGFRPAVDYGYVRVKLAQINHESKSS